MSAASLSVSPIRLSAPTFYFGRDGTDCAALRSTRPCRVCSDEGIEISTQCSRRATAPAFRRGNSIPGVSQFSPRHLAADRPITATASRASASMPDGGWLGARGRRLLRISIAAPSTEPAQASFKRTVSAAASLAGDCRDWPLAARGSAAKPPPSSPSIPAIRAIWTATWLQDTGSNGACAVPPARCRLMPGRAGRPAVQKFTRCSQGNAAIGGDFER